MSTVRPYLHGFGYVNFESSDYIASTGFCILSSKDNIMPQIIYHQLFSNKLDVQYDNCLVRTNYPALNLSDIEQLKFNIPLDINEQKAIANILFSADNGITALTNA
jgi:type I restriction enzyme S subunit